MSNPHPGFRPLFRLQGDHAGWISPELWLFDAKGVYLGWLDRAGVVWWRDGQEVGSLVDDCHVLRRDGQPLRRCSPRVPPTLPRFPPAPGARARKFPPPGLRDALGDVMRTPREDELVGDWCGGGAHLSLAADGCYALSLDDGPPVAGNWQLRGNLMLSREDDEGAFHVYRFIEYDGGRMLLQRLAVDEPSLPLTLYRQPTRSPAP